MPNRCYNSVTINGPKEDIKKIRSYIKTKSYYWLDKEGNKKVDKQTTFIDNFYPMPDVLRDSYKINTWQDYERKRAYTGGWYSWRIINRGCKRDVSPYICPTSSAKQLFFTFDSPWGPPLKAMDKLSGLHPECDIIHRYDEGGMGFSGEINRYEGEMTYHEKYDDPYYGNGKECNECGCIYDGSNPDEWYDDDNNICMYCGEDLEANKK